MTSQGGTSELLIRGGRDDGKGAWLRVLPDGAGWQYTGIEVLRLTAGETAARENDGKESFAVVVQGAARFTVDGVALADTPRRDSPFSGPPAGAYVPPGRTWSIRALTELEIAICVAPATAGPAPHAVLPGDVPRQTRGTGSNTRHVYDMLPADRPLAQNLLVVEAITPGGCWSSYPPHKHDTDDLPRESQLEELYYYRIDPPTGFAQQRIYTDDRTLDATLAPGDGDLTKVPRGYHPVGAPHGHDVYYLNVMAGPKRVWATSIDPDFAWQVAPATAPEEEG